MNITGKTVAAYIPGESTVQTVLGNDGKGIYFGNSKYQLRKKHPTITFIPLDEATGYIREVEEVKYCTMPKEITHAIWDEALGCLPPEDWRRINGVETFHCVEFYTSDISSIYFKVPYSDGRVRYFGCRNRVDRKGWLIHILLNQLMEEDKVEA